MEVGLTLWQALVPPGFGYPLPFDEGTITIVCKIVELGELEKSVAELNVDHNKYKHLHDHFREPKQHVVYLEWVMEITLHGVGSKDQINW